MCRYLSPRKSILPPKMTSTHGWYRLTVKKGASRRISLQILLFDFQDAGKAIKFHWHYFLLGLGSPAVIIFTCILSRGETNSPVRSGENIEFSGFGPVEMCSLLWFNSACRDVSYPQMETARFQMICFSDMISTKEKRWQKI
jgi:hypothetical protein